MLNLLEKIGNGVIATEAKRKIVIDGHLENMTVYKIRLNHLYYNDQNDRIATWINEYKENNGIESFNIDDNDKDKYNEIIEKFIIDSKPGAIPKTKTNIELVGQREPGVILADGRIIDGNRRFTCLRLIENEKGMQQYFEAVILEKKMQNHEKQIKELELSIQHGEESKVEYNPIDRLVGIYNDIIKNKLFTIKEYARIINETEQEVEKKVCQTNLMLEFLEYINAPKKFYLARNLKLEASLVELPLILKKCKDENKRNELKNSIFTNYLVQPEGEMRALTRKISYIVGTNQLEPFLEEQKVISEKVLDKLPSTIDENIIRDEIRADEHIKEELARSLNKAELKVKTTESKYKPNKDIEKSIDILETVDFRILQKYTDEEKKQVIKNIEKLENLIKGFKEAINV